MKGDMNGITCNIFYVVAPPRFCLVQSEVFLMDFSVLHSLEKKLSAAYTLFLGLLFGYIISGDLENPELNELEQEVWNRFLVQFAKKNLFCHLPLTNLYNSWSAVNLFYKLVNKIYNILFYV